MAACARGGQEIEEGTEDARSKQKHGAPRTRAKTPPFRTDTPEERQ